jgi:hypothetical protein
MGSGCIDPYFLDLDTSWKWVVSFTPWPLYPRGKSTWYTLDRRLGGSQSQCIQHEKKKFFTLKGLELRSICRPARSQSLYRLRYPGCLVRYIKNSILFILVLQRCLWKSSTFWVISPYSPLKPTDVSEKHRLYLQGRKISNRRNRVKQATNRELIAAWFTIVSPLTYSSTMKIKAKCFSETSVDFQWITWRYIPEYIDLYLFLTFSDYFSCEYYIGRMIDWLSESGGNGFS